MSEKNLKQQIHAGETLVGVPISLQSSRDDFDSLLEHGPYDFVCADAQHSAYNEERLVEFCNLADEFDIPVMFRIKHTRQTYMLGSYLDLGPSGLEVPQVELESTAEEAAAAFYYPSAGIRSWGGNNRKGWTNDRDRLEYAGWWDEFGVLMLQLESVDAVQNARNLAKPVALVLAEFTPETEQQLEATLELRHRCIEEGFAIFPSIGRASRAISRLVRYYRWRKEELKETAELSTTA